MTIPIERIEESETSLGIKLEGLNAVYDDSDDFMNLKILGEIISITKTGKLKDYIEINVLILDADNKIIDSESELIDKDKFLKIKPLKIECSSKNKPSKIKVYPTSL